MTSATSRTCGPGHAGDRIEVDPQLVGMIEIVCANRMRVQVDAAQVDDPGQLSGVAQHDLVSRPAGWEEQLDCLDPVRA